MRRIIGMPFIASEVDGERFIMIDNIIYKISDTHPLCSLDEYISKENFERICETQGFELGNNAQHNGHLGYEEYISIYEHTHDVHFCINKDYLILLSTKEKLSRYFCLIEGVWILEENDLLKKSEEKINGWETVFNIATRIVIIFLGIRLIVLLTSGHFSEWLKMLWIFIRNI